MTAKAVLGYAALLVAFALVGEAAAVVGRALARWRWSRRRKGGAS